MPPIGESIARRRVFWFLVALVVVPTLLLAFYGLAGLKYRRDAEEARLRERYLLQARTLEAAIYARLGEEDARIRGALAGLGPDEVEPVLVALARSGGVMDEAWIVDPVLSPPAWIGAADTLTAAEPVTFLDDLEEDGRRGTLALTRVRADLVVAWRIDPRVIDAIVLPELVGRLFPSEQATYRLREARREPTTEPVTFDHLRQSLSERLAETEPFVDRGLAPPFDHLHVQIEPTGDVAGGSARAIWIVSVLASTSVIGVILMGSAVAQQVRLSRLQRDFVSNVSHELRTPLTSIRLFIETLQSGRVTDPDKVRECLDVIAVESERLSRKIERVLSWARMEAGRRLYTLEPVRPCDLVKPSLEAFRTQLLSGQAALTVAVPDSLPLVMADTDAFSEALLNLLSNARKYGGPNVHIRLEGAADRRWVHLSVSDDGPGIPREERKRIFEKFYRPNVLVSRRQEGSGLGLAIVRAVVQAHKGRIDVESEEGRGARFTILLPRVGG